MRTRLFLLIPGLMLLVFFNSNAQCPVFQCPVQAQMVCDSSLNDTLFWNEPNYWDHTIGTHDLFEAETNLEFSVIDSCSFAGLRISYLLLLDLDGDGAQETAIWSDSLPPADTVYFGNAANPIYSSGTALHFDKRPVAANQKYGFALEQVAQGDTLTAKLRWNTSANPLIFKQPQLPGGTHKIRWFMESGAVHDTCTRIFTVQDCKKPLLKCVDTIHVNAFINGMIQLWTSDFLKQVDDNITPVSEIELGLRKAGAGTGFPYDANGDPQTSVQYLCNDQGTQLVELWAKDKAGNTSNCIGTLILIDNIGNCEPELPSFLICINTQPGNGVEETTVSVRGSGNGLPNFLFTGQTDYTGCVNFHIPLTSNSTITVERDDNPLNGVSTYDLVLITKHIIAQQALSSPYYMIAADANKSGSITSFDVVELRKLVLGIYSELPNNKSWRFIDKNFVFPNMQNPFETGFPDSLSVLNLMHNFFGEFVGVKVGDVNGTVIANTFTEPKIDDRSAEHILLPDLSAEAGQLLDIPITVSDVNAWLGFQFALQYDENQLNIESIEPGGLPDLTAESFAKTGDEIRCSWSDGVAHTLLPGDRLFTLHARALKPLRLRDALTLTDKRLRAEAYKDDNQAIVPLQLAFGTIDAANNQTAVFAPQPNPTNGGTKFPIQLMEDATVRLEIRDISGKLLYQSEPFLTAGRHLMEIPAEALPNAGCYFWTIKTGSLIQSGKLIRQ
ncbi:MAG: T9SS type A sorting domain-containing protein [Bacteroidota bacterium]